MLHFRLCKKIAGIRSSSSLHPFNELEERQNRFSLDGKSIRETVKKQERVDGKEIVSQRATIELKIYFVGKMVERSVDMRSALGQTCPRRSNTYIGTRLRDLNHLSSNCQFAAPRKIALPPGHPTPRAAFYSSPSPSLSALFPLFLRKKTEKHFCFLSDSSLFNIPIFLSFSSGVGCAYNRRNPSVFIPVIFKGDGKIITGEIYAAEDEKYALIRAASGL